MDRYGLHPLHPALVELVALRERVAAMEAAHGRPFVMERGPWEASEDGRGIASGDFTHDVSLKVSGDFTDDTQRKQYADELARRLNWATAAEAGGGATAEPEAGGVRVGAGAVSPDAARAAADELERAGQRGIRGRGGEEFLAAQMTGQNGEVSSAHD